MISTRIGLISGPGVKFSAPAPRPSTKTAVRKPSVAPMPSTFMITAFAGRITEPNTSAISRNVAMTMYSAIHGRRFSSASMDSVSIAGVPAT